ncbi:MAG: prepilin-type N-terminal cleavage/methylation domain-containing protein [Armatimonadota bacterium]
MTFSRKGFTLIELLVVIAIIAILAAILFPVFAQAKDAAKKTASLSNVKQMATASAMYTSDYDGGYPTWSDYFALYTQIGAPYYYSAAGVQAVMGGPDGPQFYWDAKLHPYVKSDNPLTVSYGGLWHSPGASTANNLRSYGMSQCFTYACDPTVSTEYVWRNESELEVPAQLPFAGESGRSGMLSAPRLFHGYYDFWKVTGSGFPFNREDPTRFARTSAGGGVAPYAYADGHAKATPRAQVYYWPASRGLATAADRAQGRCFNARFWSATASERSNSAANATANGFPCSL